MSISKNQRRYHFAYLLTKLIDASFADMRLKRAFGDVMREYDLVSSSELVKNPWVKISREGIMPDSFCLVEVIDGEDFLNRCFVMFTGPTDFTHFYYGNRYWRYATPPPTT